MLPLPLTGYNLQAYRVTVVGTLGIYLVVQIVQCTVDYVHSGIAWIVWIPILIPGVLSLT